MVARWRTAHIHCSQLNRIARKKVTGMSSRPASHSEYSVVRLVANGTSTMKSRRALLSQMSTESTRATCSNCCTCVIHSRQSSRKLSPKLRNSPHMPASAAHISASESILPSAYVVRSSTSSVAAIANTPSVNASRRAVPWVADGWVRCLITRPAY